jgi:cob(I)alamin adenosyltransferase
MMEDLVDRDSGTSSLIGDPKMSKDSLLLENSQSLDEFEAFINLFKLDSIVIIFILT